MTGSIRLAMLPLAVLTGAVAGLDSERPRPAPDQSAASTGLKPREVAERVAAEFMRRDQIPANYTHDLALEALLARADTTGERKYLE